MRKQSRGVAYLCFTPVAAQFTAFDGVIIAASTSFCGGLDAHGLTFHDSAFCCAADASREGHAMED